MKKKLLFYIGVFASAIFLFLLLALITDHVPFGKFYFFYNDGYIMYPPVLMQTARAIVSDNWFYNLHSALGSDFYNLRSLYTNSPLNILFIFPSTLKNFFDMYTFQIIFKVGLSSLTMSFYLNSTTKNKYTWKTFLFGLLYAFSSYSVANCMHVMWMDAFWLLPIIIYGIDQLVEKNKSLIYIIFLSLTMYINFYISYMICIFCLLYFIYKLYIFNKFSWKLVWKFISSSILCALLNAVILIPQVFSLISGRGSSFSFDKLLGISMFSLLGLPVNLLSGTYSYFDNMSDGSPLIYCTILVLVMNILYYFNKYISSREKRGTLFFTIFFIISLFVHFIDYSWNMFQEPVWWGHRYSFVIIFFLITIGFRAFDKIDKTKISSLYQVLITILVVVLSFLSFIFKSQLTISIYHIIGLLISLFVFIIYINFYNKKHYNFMIIFLVIVEVMCNGYVILKENSLSTERDLKHYYEKEDEIKWLKEYDDSFYRLEFMDDFIDDSMLLDYYSSSLFASSYDSNAKEFLSEKINFFKKESTNSYDPGGTNPALMTLFSFKYIVGDSDYYININDNVYLNDKYLPFGLIVPNEIKEYEYIDGDYYNNINKMYQSLIGYNPDLFWEAKTDDFDVDSSNADESIFSYSFISEEDGVLLFNSANMYPIVEIKINDVIVKEEKQKNILFVEKNDKVNIKFRVLKEQIKEDYYKIDVNKQKDFLVAILKEKQFLKVYKDLQKLNHLDNIETGRDIIRGKLKGNGGTLFLSIPYNDSFIIKIDDKRVNYDKSLGTLISVRIPEGEHEITVNYIPKGFGEGLLISCFTLFGLVSYTIIERKNNIDKK